MENVLYEYVKDEKGRMALKRVKPKKENNVTKNIKNLSNVKVRKPVSRKKKKSKKKK